MSTLRIGAVVASLLMVTTPALAASDYLLQLDPVSAQGKDAGAPQSIEVESFSWGASNAGAMATGTGKVNVQDLSMTKARAPRDASSGMATGKRVAPEATAVDGQPAAVAAVAAPKVGDVATFAVLIRESPSASVSKAGACATGTHFPHAVLVARGTRYEFTDVTETSCTSADGLTRKNYTGHVTLMK